VHDSEVDVDLRHHALAQPEYLLPLVPTAVHAEHDIGRVIPVETKHHAIVTEGQLLRPAAVHGYLPELLDTGDIGHERDRASIG
jgi:hypothetical protein